MLIMMKAITLSFVPVIIAGGWEAGFIAKEFARKFYDSPIWRRCRKAYIQYRISVDGGMCEVCRNSLGKVVHHKTWLTPENINNPQIALSFDNLCYECQDCHNREEQTEKQKEKRYYFNSDGDLVPLTPPIR